MDVSAPLDRVGLVPHASLLVAHDRHLRLCARPCEGLLPQGEQRLMAATALDAESSDTMLLCTHGGVLVEMHLDQDTPSAIGRSWDQGTLVGPGQCEGLAWVQDANSQVGVGLFNVESPCYMRPGNDLDTMHTLVESRVALSLRNPTQLPTRNINREFLVSNAAPCQRSRLTWSRALCG